nr:hypothetical protein [Gammaproteobacteria bacterium]
MNNPIQQLNKATSEAGSKTTSLAGQHLKSRNFTFTDQLEFANFSGDTNPIHIDPVAARRTISGQCIMHGIHGLLWALDTLSECTGLTASNVKVRFIKPIFLNETISCIWEEQTKQLSLISGDIVLSVATLRLGSLKSVNTIQTKIEPPRSKPKEPTFIECSSLGRQPFAIYGDSTLAKTLFPSFVKAYGIAAACEIAAISEVIGMECPGLHSLFTTLQVDFRLDSDSIPNFTLKKSDERFNLLQIFVEAHTLTGEAEAFYRPPPSSNLRITELRTFVHEDEFKNVCALIVGGSRGLGELVAKLITSGGGKSIITYNVGSADAARVQREILSFGGYCETIQLTIGETVSLPARLSDFNQLYYFATPKIFGKRSSEFDTR